MGSVMVLNGQFCCFVEAVRLFCNGVRVGSCGFLQCTFAFRLRGVEQNASFRLAPVRASDVKEKVGVTILAGLLESAAMQCHESVTFFIFRDWGIVQCQKIKLRQILSPTCVKT